MKDMHVMNESGREKGCLEKNIVGLVAIGLAIVAIAIGIAVIATNGSGSPGDVLSRLETQEARVAALINPVLNDQTANVTIEGTIDVKFSAQSFDNPTTLTGTVQDTNWNDVVMTGALTCRLLEFYKGGMRYGIVEIDAKNFTLATAGAIDRFISVSIDPCSATRVGAAKLDVSELPDVADYFVFNGIPTALNNPDGNDLPLIEVNEDGSLVFVVYSHFLTCAADPACNTIPAGVTFSITEPIRYLREISVAPTSST